MSRDKKRRHSADHRFVLLREVGDPMWDVPVTDEEALQTMETLID
jgi:3-dehydroquinate synthetase